MNLFELFVKIGVDDQASKKLSDISSKLGNGLKTAAKVGTAAVSVASTAIIALTKQSIESYAEYEQLVGGAELMFGDAFDYVKQKSQEAYKTVQMSQNEYLKQANGFATGLKTSLKGNEKAAAELADKIITAEADIIAATGNTQENVQNAFNGIMRSNFTMLDNLQIGITPTKEGFQEVIDKVNEWNATNGKATKYQMGNLADMQSALVDYIDMVGMSGYAQREASETITGSLSSMKSAWSNLITGISDDNADFNKLIENFVGSIVGYVDESGNQVKGFADNILPRIKVALGGVGSLIKELAPIISAEIPPLISSLLPDLIEGVMGIISSLSTALPEMVTMVNTVLGEQAVPLVMSLINGILGMLPEIVKSANTLILSLASGIGQALPELLPAVVSVINEIVSLLLSGENLDLVFATALELVGSLALGLADAVPILVSAVTNIVEGINKFATNPENIALIIGTALQIIFALGGGIISAIPELLKSIGIVIASIISNFKDADWAGMGKNIVEGLKKGISSAWTNLKKWFKNLFGDLIDIAKKILGIASPSKVFKKIGGFVADGFGIGFEDTFGDVEDNIQNSLDFGDSDYGITTATSTISSYSNGGRNGNGTQNVNVTVGIDDSANPMGLARALLPYLKIAEKEAYA